MIGVIVCALVKEQAPALRKKLDEAGVQYVYKLYGDDRNPQGHVFHLDMHNEMGKLCNDEECAFFHGVIEK